MISYEALGLLTSIPLDQSSNPTSKQSIKEAEENLISGYGRIVRDAEGNVIDVILPEDEDEAKAGEDAAEDSGEEGAKEMAPVPAKTEVVKSEYSSCRLIKSKAHLAYNGCHIRKFLALEILSASAVPVKRHTSMSEKEWLTQLVIKYGDDKASMARDAKLNVWQKTSGEIGRM